MPVSRRKFALIGAGVFGEMHAKTYHAHPGVELTAICDISAERARGMAAKYGAGRACTDWREIATDPGIDAVSVVTPDFAHTEIAVGLAQAGKHLLVEKPLAMTVEDCEGIIRAAKESGVKLMVDFHNRWNPAFAEAHQQIRSDELGAPRFVYLRASDTTFVPLTMLPWAAKSSSLWFLGSHAIDLACWLLGEWPRRVYGVAPRGVLRERGVDVPDFYQSVLEFPSGAVASIENSWLLPPSFPTIFDLKCEVIGAKGAIHIDISSARTLQIVGEKGLRYGDVIAAPVVHGEPKGFLIESIRHFADCVLEDKEPLVSGEDGLEVTRTACGIELSVQTGEPVLLERA